MNNSKSNAKLTASDALIIVYDSIISRYPDRRIGNITVQPVPPYYIIKMYDLPKLGAEAQEHNGIEVKIDRISGNILDLKLFAELSPYSTLAIPDSTISGRKAFQIGLDALKGFETFDKEGELTVVLVKEIYQVTFPLLPEQKSSRGAEYAFQIWINSISAKVVKILGAS